MTSSEHLDTFCDVTIDIRRSRRRVASLVLAAAVPFALVVPSAAVAAPSGQAVLLSTKPAITSAAPVAVILLGQPFTHTFTATGDPKPTWSISGSVPRGLTFNATTGVLSGVPTASLISANIFTVTATNSAGSASQTATIVTALTLGGGSGGGGTTNTQPVITSQVPVGVVIGQPYSHQFTASGNPAPTWSYTGTLPEGLTLNPATGLLSGTPTSTVGASVFTVIATNSAGSAQQPVVLASVALASRPSITSVATLAGTVGTPFAFEATASAIPVARWSVQGDLPAGITLNADTGIFTGIPTAAGTSNFTLVATNSAGSDEQNVTFVVAAAGALPILDASTTVVGTAGKALSVDLTATGNPTWAVASGTLPGGLSLNAETGTISGTPSAPGTTTVNISATNIAGLAETDVTFVIYPPQLAVTPDPGTERYSGPDRVLTSVDVSRSLFPTTESANTVVLTTSDRYADALAGGRLASAEGGPLLLNPQASLSGDVAAEIQRVLKPNGTVYVLGGDSALSPAVAASVEALPGNHQVRRISGNTRFDTAIGIADAVTAVSGGAASGPIYLVNGQNFPDGLAVSALAARTNGVVLLTDDDELPAVTANYVVAHDATGANTIPVGGRAEDASNQLPTVAARAANDNAVVGADRYDTAARVAAEFTGGSARIPTIAVGLATGENWPDALVGAAAMGALNSPLLLSPRVSLDTSVQGALASLNAVNPVSAGLVFGGTGSLSAETMTSFAALVPGDTTDAG